MSSIQLSDQLLSEIQRVLQEHDSNTQNLGVAIQYLAALQGFLLAQFPGEADQKRELLSELFGFSEHVLNQHIEKHSTPAAPAEDAFGIWKPSS